MAASSVEVRLAELERRFGLPDGAVERLTRLLGLVAAEPIAITSVRDPARGVDVHVADSLAALEVDGVRDATRVADLGAGGGFPGLVLAVALPAATVTLVESERRKCEFLARAAADIGVPNVAVVNARAESWPAGIRAHDLVTARALAPLTVLVEYAAPLLAPGGRLCAWKGRRDGAEERDGAAAAALLGMSPPMPWAVTGVRGADERHLYLSSKVATTPDGYPRRPGMARKRPLRASTGR